MLTGMIRIRKFLHQSAVILLFASTPTVFADPLDEVIESDRYQELKKSVDSNQQKLDLWVDPSSDFGRVLLNSDSTSELWEWLHEPPTSVVQKKGFVKHHREYLELTQSYQGVDKPATLRVTFYIPFPKFGPMSDHGLVSDLNALEPPALATRSSEDIKIGELTGKLYHEFSNECSIVLKLPKFTRVQGKISTCATINLLTNLMESLRIEEVARRFGKEPEGKE